MRTTILLLAILAAACSSSTAPKPGTDPSVLVINLTADHVKLIWAADSAGRPKVDTVIVGPNTTVCEKWTQSFDSLYSKVIDSLSTTHPSAWAEVTTPWVHFSDYRGTPNYFQRDTVEWDNSGVSLSIINRADSTECQ